MWVVLIILIIGIIWLIKKKPKHEIQQMEMTSPVPKIDDSSGSCEEEELIAVITAAIAEFTNMSEDEFKVINIRQCSKNWLLTGRQEIMRNRL